MNCKVCKLAVAEAERGRCRACQADCHIKCLKGKTREQMLCPLCSEGASGGDDTRRETPAALGQSAVRKWYLPIFTVCNPNKPGKVLVVWDGAAEFHGVSLSSQLMVGPDLNAALVNVLMRFQL